MTLTGYKFNENLYKGTRTEVYHGTRTRDLQPVIIKVIRNRHPNFNELVQFRNQYVITRNLEHRAIVQPLALERYGNGYALVMPDDRAIGLWDYWQESSRSKTEFLNIAIQLAEALHYLSGQRIIHKDIKPTNILINPETGKVLLIDFSISSLLPLEQQQLLNPNVLEGTLAYISPEQTGRMNRGIDYRTDFYSLGVTFFELLTGQLPFITDDPIELVHCHIAQDVQFPCDSEVPKVVQDLVLKLMAKNAEDRYQSAFGLKHDLERCLQQLSSTGKIAGFELGQKDRCDRFIIPEKLYGREREVQTLLEAFDRVSAGATEMMLVAGFSGIGKTAVINEVHKPIARQRGYFIKGKFDQFNRNIPFSAFVQAFRDLMGQLLGSDDAELARWKAKITEAVGENGQVIIDVIPELELLIGLQPAAPELSGNAAQNRFNLLFCKFVRVFTTIEHPLVIFLDDLQWADSASLNLLKLLMDSSAGGYLLVLGAYRDNEVFPAHPLMLTCDDILKQGAIANTLTLGNLSSDDITRLVADTLLCSVEIAAPLSQLVYQKTQGNPFFTTQFLKGLHADKFITFEADGLYWQCDMVQVRTLALTDDVVEFMVGRLQKLSTLTQEVLKMAACIGNQFDLETLAVVCETTPEEVATCLWPGLLSGFVIPSGETYKFFQGESAESASDVDDVEVGYRFLHDRVQQAAYALIREADKQKTHLKIGRLLLSNTPEANRETQIFAIVSQLNLGATLIAEPLEREELARLNLIAARKAKGATAYQAARDNLQMARQLLADDCWENQYELTRDVYEEAALVAYLMGNFEQSDIYGGEVLERGKTILEKIEIYQIKIQSQLPRQQINEAIDLGFGVLESLGIVLETEPPSLEQISAVKNLPDMSDPYKLAAIKILSSIIDSLFVTNQTFFQQVIYTILNLSVKYGNSMQGSRSYVGYSVILCGIEGDVERGYSLGKMGLELFMERFSAQAKEQIAVVLHDFNGCVRHWKEHLQNSLASCLEAFNIGQENGEMIASGYHVFTYLEYLWYLGESLDLLAAKCQDYLEILEKQNLVYHVDGVKLQHQAALNLLGRSENSIELIGEDFDETEKISKFQAEQLGIFLFFIYGIKGQLAYFFGEIERTIDWTQEARKWQDNATGFFLVAVNQFYASLGLLKAYPNSDPDRQQEIILQVESDQQQMQYWASHAPMNFQHKYELVAAEKAKVEGQNWQAAELYDRAISGAKENSYLQEEALANELAALFYLDCGKEKIAAIYMQEAYYCYTRWGAKAKIDQLEAKYRQLLTPILQQSEPVGNLSDRRTFTQSLGTVTSTTSVLDLASAIKAGQAISSEIELEALLSKLMRIVGENAGADKGALILESDGTCQIAAICANGTCHLETMPLNQTDSLPISIINTVKRRRQTIAIDNIEQDKTFTGDPYLLEEPPKSLCCTPIINQGKLIGILYLENNLTAEAFSSDRIEVLNLLSAQAAISIENARLYSSLEDYSHNLEVKVSQRTEELQEKNQHLQQTLGQLQQTQAQLIQAEKMSSLGQMVAGIAHEINNPITFIAGNISHAKEYFQDLLDLLDLYEQNWTDPSEAILDKLEEIDLDYLRDDLENLLGSMENGSSRIRKIVLGLRNFSRLDESERKPVDLHDGLENTLMILQHRLQGNDSRPEIAIVKNYGTLPPVNCYASQLNQVFMHIITNAIEALRDDGDRPEIIITTQMLDSQTVRIAIADNGPGIPESDQGRIFDPFFTTKPVGQGTGLGLSISYQIITEQHKGQLHCISHPGLGTELAIDLPIGMRSSLFNLGFVEVCRSRDRPPDVI